MAAWCARRMPWTRFVADVMAEPGREPTPVIDAEGPQIALIVLLHCRTTIWQLIESLSLRTREEIPAAGQASVTRFARAECASELMASRALKHLNGFNDPIVSTGTSSRLDARRHWTGPPFHTSADPYRADTPRSRPKQQSARHLDPSAARHPRHPRRGGRCLLDVTSKPAVEAAQMERPNAEEPSSAIRRQLCAIAVTLQPVRQECSTPA